MQAVVEAGLLRVHCKLLSLWLFISSPLLPPYMYMYIHTVYTLHAQLWRSPDLLDGRRFDLQVVQLAAHRHHTLGAVAGHSADVAARGRVPLAGVGGWGGGKILEDEIDSGYFWYNLM